MFDTQARLTASAASDNGYQPLRRTAGLQIHIADMRLLLNGGCALHTILSLSQEYGGDTHTEGILSEPDLIKHHLQTDGVNDQTHVASLH